jgi:hypothetical protein
MFDLVVWSFILALTPLLLGLTARLIRGADHILTTRTEWPRIHSPSGSSFRLEPCNRVRSGPK